MHHFGVHRQAQLLRQFGVKEQRRIDKRKRTRFQPRTDMHILARLELRATRIEVDTPRRAELSGRLKDVTFLPVVERNLVNVLERELTQIHLPVLGVTELNTIVIDAQMVRTHRADINRLDAPYPAIVFYLHAGEETDGVCHGEAVQLLQLFAL